MQRQTEKNVKIVMQIVSFSEKVQFFDIIHAMTTCVKEKISLFLKGIMLSNLTIIFSQSPENIVSTFICMHCKISQTFR